MEAHAHFRAPRTPLVPPGGVDLHQRDMTATFSADLTLAEAQRHLAEIGQWLPIDGDPDASLGSLIEFNSTGPLRLGYGAWRDLLLGVQFTNLEGAFITAGGRTVKNVAGYDLTKLMVGQRRVFGRLVTLTTRTYRRPEGAIVVELPPEPLRINELLPSPLRPQWAALTADALRLGYIGDARTLAFWRENLPTLAPISIRARSLEDDIRHRHQLWSAFPEPSFRAAVPPARLTEFVRLAKLEDWTADAAFGVVVGRTSKSPESVEQKAAREVGGNCALSDQPAMHTDVERELIQRLLRAFRTRHPTAATSRKDGSAS